MSSADSPFPDWAAGLAGIALEVEEELPTSVSLPDDTTVADLVLALNRVEASSRDIIVILQAIKRAGALHAELVIE